MADYIIMVFEHKQHPEQAYKSCSGILSMVRKVGNERLANACKRAHEYGIYNYPIIVQILDRNLDRMSKEPEELPMRSILTSGAANTMNNYLRNNKNQ